MTLLTCRCTFFYTFTWICVSNAGSVFNWLFPSNFIFILRFCILKISFVLLYILWKPNPLLKVHFVIFVMSTLFFKIQPEITLIYKDVVLCNNSLPFLFNVWLFSIKVLCIDHFLNLNLINFSKSFNYYYSVSLNFFILV